MKLAIHKSAWGFSHDWIQYCEQNNIPHKIVDCYASDIVQQVSDCDALLFHHHHILAKDKLFAQQLLFSLEQSGMKVFPDFKTGWHFDDKLGQKYLLEAVGAPLVQTFAFYSKIDALKWFETTTFPKVFKLRGGAGSANVKLVRSKSDAVALANKAFGKGFAGYDKMGNLSEVVRKFLLKKASAKDILKSVRRIFMSTEFARVHGPERGYMLFQEFIPNNAFDIRVVVIGKKAFALKRMVREGDFRASGSGFIKYEKSEIDERCIKIGFDVSEKLGANCVAYDFVFDPQNTPLIVEINYGFAHEAYFDCPGFWDSDMNWHEQSFNAAHLIVETVIEKL